MPSTSIGKRTLDRLLRLLGEDANLSEQPKLDTSRVVLVSQVDDLSFGHPAAGFGRFLASITPTVGAATFCAIEFTPDEGLWVREISVTGGNTRIYMQFGGSGIGAFTVSDNLALYTSIVGRPEDGDFPTFTTAQWDALVAGSATVPKIFRGATIGQATANPQTGLFLPAAITYRDLWVPAGATFSVVAATVNVGITFYMQLELPAENFLT